jgi:hypothetical protein
VTLRSLRRRPACSLQCLRHEQGRAKRIVLFAMRKADARVAAVSLTPLRDECCPRRARRSPAVERPTHDAPTLPARLPAGTINRELRKARRGHVVVQAVCSRHGKKKETRLDASGPRKRCRSTSMGSGSGRCSSFLGGNEKQPHSTRKAFSCLKMRGTHEADGLR